MFIDSKNNSHISYRNSINIIITVNAFKLG